MSFCPQAVFVKVRKMTQKSNTFKSFRGLEQEKHLVADDIIQCTFFFHTGFHLCSHENALETGLHIHYR